MTVTARGWWKAVLAAAMAALVGAWFRHREPEILDEAAPGTAQWPPLAPLAGDATALAADETPENGNVAEPAADAAAGAAWVAPDADGNCPLSHPVKVKESSGIHHVPGGLSYDRTNADRCYPTPAAAQSDGYRAAKR